MKLFSYRVHRPSGIFLGHWAAEHWAAARLGVATHHACPWADVEVEEVTK